MPLVPRPAKVRGLLDDPAYAQRVLNRITACIAIDDRRQLPVIDLETVGTIPETVLEQITLVRISKGESLAARVLAARSTEGDCRVTLCPWMGFINHEPSRPQLDPGIHLWLGAAWRHLPFPRTA